MFPRTHWQERIEQAWREAPIAWLCGVRRCGKTTLAESLGADRTTFVNCDIPSVEDRIRDPQLFYRSVDKPIVVFDEIHQLRDPTRLLKIGADEFPNVKILATGSSTLAASRKFRDTLTGRKRTIHLVPVLWTELDTFGVNTDRRLSHGGLPPALLAQTKEPSFYREWLDSFFARDIQRLFRFRDMNRFNAFFEYVLRQSGGQFESSKAARELGITRPTVETHLRALEITNAATLVRPFFKAGSSEITKMPKVYAFDTGFVSYARGWEPLRQEDRGVLWEHIVLEHLQAYWPDSTVRYWRDKSGREVDFILTRQRDEIDAIECKWNPKELDSTAVEAFRELYPKGRNYVLTPHSENGFMMRVGAIEVTVCGLGEFRPARGSVAT